MIWNNLVKYMQQHDGSVIHPSLDLRSHCDVRGLFTSDTIQSGTIIIQLPLVASIHGQRMPMSYNNNTETHEIITTTSTTPLQVSPWLRCVAALMKEMIVNNNSSSSTSNTTSKSTAPYLASLPSSYETLWHWSIEEVEEYLAGTRPPHPAIDVNETSLPTTTKFNTATAQSLWMIDPQQMQQQYYTSIRPYLIHCGIISTTTSNNNNHTSDEEEGYKTFQIVCQIISTRSFYMNQNGDSTNHHSDIALDHESCTSSEYNGPYLLPVIDLINHTDISTGRTNTKLELYQDRFVMRALCTILPNVEILHSYGDTIPNYQFLSSFGCIPMNRIEEQIVQKNVDSNNCGTSSYMKSVVLTKQEIWDTCYDLIKSGLPQQLAKTIEESSEIDDETWSVVLDENRTADCVPNNIVIVAPTVSPPTSTTEQMTTIIDNDGMGEYNFDTNNNILSDELVTVACIPFLPKCAYAEITSRTLFDASILQDYYLGQLVGTALLQTIQRRLLLYRPITSTTIQRLLLPPPADAAGSYSNVVKLDDMDILQRLFPYIQSSSDNSNKRSNSNEPDDLYTERCRLAYGLTIRLEENAILKSLGNAIVSLINNLNVDEGSNDDDDNNIEHCMTTKKYKTTED